MKYVWNKYEKRYELTQEEAIALNKYLEDKTGCPNIQEVRIYRDGVTIVEIEGIEWGGYVEV